MGLEWDYQRLKRERGLQGSAESILFMSGNENVLEVWRRDTRRVPKNPK